MLNKDTYCLETIIEAIGRIQEYSSGFNSADEFNNDYRSFDATMMICCHWGDGREAI